MLEGVGACMGGAGVCEGGVMCCTGGDLARPIALAYPLLEGRHDAVRTVLRLRGRGCWGEAADPLQRGHGLGPKKPDLDHEEGRERVDERIIKIERLIVVHLGGLTQRQNVHRGLRPAGLRSDERA